GIEAYMLMRHGDEAQRLLALRLSLRDRLLIEADLAAGGEEEMVDAALGHRADDGVADLGCGLFDPLDRLVLGHRRLPSRRLGCGAEIAAKPHIMQASPRSDRAPPRRAIERPGEFD